MALPKPRVYAKPLTRTLLTPLHRFRAVGRVIGRQRVSAVGAQLRAKPARSDAASPAPRVPTRAPITPSQRATHLWLRERAFCAQLVAPALNASLTGARALMVIKVARLPTPLTRANGGTPALSLGTRAVLLPPLGQTVPCVAYASFALPIRATLKVR